MDHLERRAVRDRLLAVLVKAMKERSARNETHRGETGWVAYERAVMHVAVNEERAKLEKPPVDDGKIRSAESKAFGHSDYAEKFALYCTELVER
jgi:hypothetical protein